ncbi:HNH endonuclease signature motif containing protein [Gordonia araii]|nr:HNH endonuclease signature motif containing protein [Gordonia araii]
MRVDDLTTLVTELSDDLTPAATDTGHGIGALLADAEPIADDQMLLTVMAAAFRLGTICDYLLAAATSRAQAIGLPKRKQLRDGRDVLRQLPLAPSAVARLGRLADNLPALPHLAREIRDGDLSLEHADAVIRGLTHVASRMDADGYTTVKDAVATRLLAHARGETPTQVMAQAHELAHQLAPAHPPAIPPAENPMLNEAEITRTDEGRVRLAADLDQLSGEKLLTALDTLTKPVPAPDGGRDPRTHPQRLADGLIDILDTYLAHPDRPTTGGIVPHITLTVPLPILTGHDDRAADRCNDSVAATPIGDHIPRLGFTGAISTATASELCCGNPELTAILTADSVPLDLKRTQRLATPALRTALIARDHGCQFPGCGKPASWTDAHHIKEWRDGGQTTLDNLVLLCRYHHHTAIHTHGWHVMIGSDRHPWFQPPQGGDWIRCHQRRTLTHTTHAAT